MQKVYNRIYWENDPSHNTPLSESNLNKLDYALDVVDTRVAELSGYEERAEESADSADASAAEARELKRQVQALVAAVNAITANATTLNPGSSATASFDSSTGVLSLGIPRGDSGGITAPVNGMYTMYVDSDGNLWLVTNGEQGSEYWWQYNPTTGELYYRTPGEYVEKTIVGDVIVEITDGVEGFPIKSLVAEITPIQSGTGDPSPTNIRPISGRTGLTVTRAGKNVFPKRAVGSQTIHGITFDTREDGTIHVYGTATAQADLAIFTANSVTLPAGTYTVKRPPSNNTQFIIGGASNTSGLAYHAVYSSADYTFTIANTGTIGNTILRVLSGATVDVVFELQIEAGSTSTDYTPYKGQTYPISWQTEAGTVYGGTLDVVSGVLTVDRVMETITKDGTWYLFVTGSGNASAVIQLRGYQNVKYVEGASSRNGAIASTGVEAQNYWVGARQNEIPPDGDMCFAYSSSGQLRFHRSDVANITDLETFKAAFPDTQIVYPLATPQTYQLTPTEIAYIEILNGINILYTDAGSINEVTYIVESYEED